MNQNLQMAKLRGCDREPLSLILVKADVSSISKVFTEYFELDVYKNSHLKRYLQLEEDAYYARIKLQSESKKSLIKQSQKTSDFPTLVWRYHGHQWSIVFLMGKNDDIAFAFSTLLDTDVITFWDSKHCCCSEFKLFRSDMLVEHYRFGLESQAYYDDRDYWDLVVECETDWLQGLEAHKFCSSLRTVTAQDIKLAVESKRALLHESGFLDTCLRYYDAYLPALENTPLNEQDARHDFVQTWQNSVEQMDIVMRSNYWAYYDRNVPQLVVKD